MKKVPLLDGRYRIVKVLGNGAMGMVCEVEDVTLGGPHLAMKIFHPSNSDKEDSLLRRFDREARILYKISQNADRRSVRLPRVLIYEPNPAEAPPYYVMDLILGPDGKVCNLESVKESAQDIFSLEQAETWFRDVCLSLNVLHDNGCLHRDIKPENILIDAEGHAVIADFGTAKVLPGSEGEGKDDSLTFVGRFEREQVGTRRFWAPELRDGSEATVASDIYALAVTFWRVLFDEDFKSSDYPPDAGRFDDFDEYGEKWRRSLVPMLAPKPADRPSSAAECWRLYEGGESAGIPRRGKGMLGRYRIALVVAAILALGFLALSFVFDMWNDGGHGAVGLLGDTRQVEREELDDVCFQNYSFVTRALVGSIRNDRTLAYVDVRCLFRASVDIDAYTNAVNRISDVLEGRFGLKPVVSEVDIAIEYGLKEGWLGDSMEGEIIELGFNGQFDSADVGLVDSKSYFEAATTAASSLVVIIPEIDADGVAKYKKVRYSLNNKSRQWLQDRLQAKPPRQAQRWLWLVGKNKGKRDVLAKKPMNYGDFADLSLRDVCMVQDVGSGGIDVTITPWLKNGTVESSYFWINVENITLEMFEGLETVKLVKGSVSYAF